MRRGGLGSFSLGSPQVLWRQGISIYVPVSSVASSIYYRRTPSQAERECGPDSATELRLRPVEYSSIGRGNAIQAGDAACNPGKSYLFCLRDRDPGIPSRGERVTDTAVKGHPEERGVYVPSVVVAGWPLKIRWEGNAFGRSRSLVPISASGLQGEQPLVDGRM